MSDEIFVTTPPLLYLHPFFSCQTTANSIEREGRHSTRSLCLNQTLIHTREAEIESTALTMADFRVAAMDEYLAQL